ncbi:MAG: DinB family protein [Candidatus Thorarchaeota archaeon]|jgi:uncharacterized damage-inducible protein DinB
MSSNDDVLEKIMIRALRGHPDNAHVDPLIAIDGLTPTQARQNPKGSSCSVWRILFHMVHWQDLAIRAMSGERINWDESGKKGWPERDIMFLDTEWEALVERFVEGVKHLEVLLRLGGLTEPLAGWKNKPLADLFMISIIHNSYHIGQIVLLRKMLNIWLRDDV